jgi:energy-converting hydrogenase A subunit M
MPIFEALLPDELELGAVLRIPVEFVEAKSKSKSNETLVKSLANKLKISNKNILPIIVKQKDEDSYEAIHNTLILEAAKQAGLDFVWCIPVDSKMEAQILAETGELFQVSLLNSSEKEIVEALAFARDTEASLKKLDTAKVAKAIVTARTPSWKDLKPLSKLKCGVGAKTAPVLSKYFDFTAFI